MEDTAFYPIGETKVQSGSQRVSGAGEPGRIRPASFSPMESAGAEESAEEMRKVAEAIKYSVIIVSTFPMLCLYPFAQKYFAKGVMLGAIKG